MVYTIRNVHAFYIQFFFSLCMHVCVCVWCVCVMIGFVKTHFIHLKYINIQFFLTMKS